MSSPLLKPDLYDEGPEGVVLICGRCPCGRVAFPFQTLGCEICGRHGEAISRVRLAARGVVVSSATVHLHAGKGREAPFDVCVARLEDGPTVRSLMTSVGAPPQPGREVRAVLIETDGREPGERVRDLRFEAL